MNRIAAKYCFRARAHLRHKLTKRVVGTFTTYDKSPESLKNIQLMCKLHEEDNTLECTDVELIFYNECPTECDGEISVAFYSEGNELELEQEE